MAKKKELDMKAGMQYEDMPLASLRPIKFKKAPKKPVKKSIITSEPPTHKILKVVVLYHIPLIIGVWLSGWFAHSQDNKKFESLLCLVLALVVTNILEKNAYGKYKRGR